MNELSCAWITRVSLILTDVLVCTFTVPGDPQNVRATAINSTAVHVVWEPPKVKERNGIIRGYHVHVQEVNEVRTVILYVTLFLQEWLTKLEDSGNPTN